MPTNFQAVCLAIHAHLRVTVHPVGRQSPVVRGAGGDAIVHIPAVRQIRFGQIPGGPAIAAENAECVLCVQVQMLLIYETNWSIQRINYF